MLKKIGTYLFIGFLIIFFSWAVFCAIPLFVHTAISALELWKEIL